MKCKYFLFLIFAINCVNAAEVTTFVSPDCSFESLEKFISDASSSLYIATYEFTNPCILDLLNEKNISDLKVLIESSPVGGMPLEEKKILCNLEKNGKKIYLYKKEGRNYHHAKYMIRDNSSILIASENFGCTGFSKNPTYGNRGFGAIVKDEQLTKDFLRIFFTDLKNAEKFKCDLMNYEISCNPINGNYKPIFRPEKFYNQSVYSIFAPDATSEILNLINSSNKSINIELFYIYKYWGSKKKGSINETPNLFLERVINKSRKKINVKILLDSYFYNIDKSNPVSNYNTVKYINKIAKEENLSLEAKLINLNKFGFEKLHNKGVIIDNKTVLISSINWNEHSPKNNREACIVITGEAAKYYAKVFSYDWSGKHTKNISNIPFQKTIIIITVLLLISLILIYFKTK